MQKEPGAARHLMVTGWVSEGLWSTVEVVRSLAKKHGGLMRSDRWLSKCVCAPQQAQRHSPIFSFRSPV